MESRMDKYSTSEIPRSRASRNEQLYKDITKTELRNYEVKSNATVLTDSKNSIDVDKIKSILDTHYNDTPKRRTIAIEQNVEEKTNPIFETKEYDINVVIDKAKDQKNDNIADDQHRKLDDTEFNILKNLDIDEEIPEDKVITEKKSKELEELINTISINEKELSKKELDDTDETTEEDLFASLLGNDETQTLSGAHNNLGEEIEKLKTESIEVVEEDKTKEELKPQKEEKLENSFFTKSNAIKKDDYENYEELDEEKDSSNTFIKVLIAILLIIFIIGIIVLVKSFI